jgi:flagellar hook assembly protein FlgD
VSFALAAPASWKLTIETKAGVVLRTYTGQAGLAAPVSVRWDGRSGSGARAYGGAYVARVTATNNLGAIQQTVPFTVVRR